MIVVLLNVMLIIHTYFICLTIVLLPDSPAPETEKNVIIYVSYMVLIFFKFFKCFTVASFQATNHMDLDSSPW